MDFWRPGNIEYFREVGALRSSHIGEFWNTTLRAKARGFKPSNVFVKKLVGWHKPPFVSCL